MKLIACELDDVIPCPAESVIHIDSTASELIINGGFDWEVFELVMYYSITFWALGLVVGVIIAQIRKTRNIG